MNVLQLLRVRFAEALTGLAPDPGPLLDLIRPSQDAKFGDYQANIAMSLGKQLGRNPRDVAAEIKSKLRWQDLCTEPEIAGPGFLNLRLRDDWLTSQATTLDAERLGIAKVAQPKTYVIDYSAPNIAKPMHVGHIRSTVIGNALDRILRFLGHKVISDNHVGDWGTQFGMILVGYRLFLDREAYQQSPVTELSRLYRLVRQLMDYQNAVEDLPKLRQKLEDKKQQLSNLESQQPADAAAKKKHGQQLEKLRKSLIEEEAELQELQAGKIRKTEQDAQLLAWAKKYPNLESQALAETAQLHAGDQERRKLWEEFLPPCLEEMNQVYRRLDVTFDVTLGESFYQPMLKDVVADLIAKGLARESEGAQCLFLPGFATPFLIQKRDGAFLYATTDLATIRYRMQTWNPNAILYVVDHRQSDHFQQLFATARLWGYDHVELTHVNFGTVMGTDGKPFKTRTGDVVELDDLLNEAIDRAFKVVNELDDAKKGGSELSPEERRDVAQVIGLSAVKYSDLSQNRTSDYVFSYDKMVALEGNTATYIQYAYARCRAIFRKGQIDPETLNDKPIVFSDKSIERAIVLDLLRFSEALDLVVYDYRPNQLTSYLYELATKMSRFYVDCPVLQAETSELRDSRLRLCKLVSETLQVGLKLLGIATVRRM